MDGLYTVGQSLEKSLSPATRSVRGGFLIRVLVGFREEAHVQVIRCRIFTHRDPEFLCEFCAFLWLFPFGEVRSEQPRLGRLVGNA